jgi:hypothetical protein
LKIVHPSLSLVATMLLVGLGYAPDARAQNAPSTIGAIAGYNMSSGVWQPESETEAVGGFIVGAFAHAKTPVSWFSVMAEALIVQRGNNLAPGTPGDPIKGAVRSEYATMTVAPRLTLHVGPLQLHVGGGPSVDLLLRSRLDAGLGPVLFRDHGTVFGVTGGVGLGMAVGQRYQVEVEARLYEGLSDAYSGNFVSVRNRSAEFVARVGIPRPRD